MPTVADTISIAKISQYLIANDIAKKDAFQRGSLKTFNPDLIYMVRKGIERIYERDNDYAYLESGAKYLYWLCGKWSAKAQVILNLGLTGGNAVITPELATSIAWINEEIEVGASGSALSNGATSYTLSYPNIIRKSVSVELPQANIPVAETNQFSYTIAYGANSAVISFLNDDGTGTNLGVQTGMLLIIRGAHIVATSTPTSAAIPPPTITVYGDEVVSNVYTNSDYAGWNLTVFHNGVKFLTEGVHYTVNAIGGITLIGTYAGLTLTHDDEFIITPNGLL